MLIYLDRISQTNPVFCITPMNAHRMIVTGLVLVGRKSYSPLLAAFGLRLGQLLRF
jgi:hypothetical protein